MRGMIRRMGVVDLSVVNMLVVKMLLLQVQLSTFWAYCGHRQEVFIVVDVVVVEVVWVMNLDVMNS